MIFFLICTFPADSVIEFANYLYKSEIYDASITEYKRALFMKAKDSLWINLQIGRAYYLLNDYDNSIKYLEKVKNDTTNTIIGFIHLDNKNIAEADKYFNKIKNKELKEKINMGYNELIKLNKKNEVIAGILGIIPGVGKMYTGRWEDGLLSIIFIGNYALLSYYSYKKRKHSYAIGLGIFSFLLYIGNIYGGVKAARIYNERNYYKKLNEFKNNFSYIIY